MLNPLLVIAALTTGSDPVDLDIHYFFLTNHYYHMLHATNDEQKERDKLLKKHWKILCKGGGRYEAMAEAYDMGMPNPCDGSKEWKR